MAWWLALLDLQARPVPPHAVHAEAVRALTQGGVLAVQQAILAWVRAATLGGLVVLGLLLLYGLWRVQIDPAGTRLR